jgi:uncharacterized protein (DUF2252 family)
MVNIEGATRKYEAWLRRQTKVVGKDLETKHEHMDSEAFTFLRATFYRWAQVWPETCADLTSAPTVLPVGDLHVENFGTWRDSEGRLVWGINDFDEACRLPYTSDLVRLATSALLASSQKKLHSKPKGACEAILDGYSAAIESDGGPHVLAEHFWWLRDLAMNKRRDPVKFWKNLTRFRRINVPTDVAKLIGSALPGDGKDCWFVKRVSGEGSLGRQRFVGIVEWKGSYVAREAKALVPSAAA